MTHRRRNPTWLSSPDGHGRIEVRKVWCTPEVQWLKEKEDWAGLRSLAVVESHREVQGRTSVERRYYISSRCGTDARVMAGAIREHWGIENRVHWQLGVFSLAKAMRWARRLEKSTLTIGRVIGGPAAVGCVSGMVIPRLPRWLSVVLSFV